jgi:hypothetical protein
MHCYFSLVVAPSSLARSILPPATILCVTAPLGISVSGRPHGLHRQITLRLRSGQLAGFLTSSFFISAVVSRFDPRRPIFRFFSSSRSFQIGSFRLVYLFLRSLCCAFPTPPPQHPEAHQHGFPPDTHHQNHAGHLRPDGFGPLGLWYGSHDMHKEPRLTRSLTTQ